MRQPPSPDEIFVRTVALTMAVLYVAFVLFACLKAYENQ